MTNTISSNSNSANNNGSTSAPLTRDELFVQEAPGFLAKLGLVQEKERKVASSILTPKVEEAEAIAKEKAALVKQRMAEAEVIQQDKERMNKATASLKQSLSELKELKEIEKADFVESAKSLSEFSSLLEEFADL